MNILDEFHLSPLSTSHRGDSYFFILESFARIDVMERPDSDVSPVGRSCNASAEKKSVSKLDQGWRKIVRNFTPS